MSATGVHVKTKKRKNWKQKLIPKLILMDDAFIRVVLLDVKCTEFILQTILGKPDLKVKKQFLQMDLKNLQGRSLILDCLCTDKNGIVYNIELQNGTKGASPKRARYHSGLIDMNILKAGKNFENLPESYVIFICEKDVLKENRQIYHISRVIEESGKLFPDKTHIIYLNTGKTSQDELGKLIEDFYAEDPREMHSRILSQRVKELKETSYIEEGEGNTMSSYFERLKRQWKKEAVAEGLAEGLAEGREEGRAESEARMAKLMGLLAEEGRISDIKKASENEAYRKSLLQEFQLI